jgi:hypothetical protein
VLIFACPNIGKTADVAPMETQKQSLKGITSLRYGVVKYSTYSLLDEVGNALSGLKLPIKQIENLKKESNSPLSITEARVKVIAEDREDNQCWVGLYVEQLCQLKRIPSITIDRETYKIGKMCAPTEVKTIVKDLCAEFVKDLSSAQ